MGSLILRALKLGLLSQLMVPVSTLDSPLEERALQAEKQAHHKYKKNNSDFGLPSRGIQHNQTVRHRYEMYPFCIYGVLGFFRLHSGLSVSWA